MPRLTMLLLLCASSAAVAQQNPALTTLRVAPPAKMLVGKKSTPLLPSKAIAPGNRVSTGAGGRAALQLGAGVMTLGGDAELYVHSTASGESADIARLVLTRGALRVQGARESALPPLDLRLNVGPLRLRSVGASLWTASETRGETVCLLSGSVEIAAEFGTEKLEQAGDCLFFSAQNRRLVLKPDSADTLAQKLEQTAFASDLVTGRASLDVIAGPQGTPGLGEPEAGAPVEVAGGESVEVDSGFVVIEAPPPPPLPEPQPIAPPSPPPAVVTMSEPVVTLPPPAPAPEDPPLLSTLPPSAAAGETPRETQSPPQPAAPPREREPATALPLQTLLGGWFVVVASPGSQAGAEAHAAKLRNSGLAAAVRSGAGRHRVVVGPYASRGAADAERAKLQSRLKISGAWILQD